MISLELELLYKAINFKQTHSSLNQCYGSH